MHNALKRSHTLSVLSSKFLEGACPFLKEGGDGVHRIAGFELFGERMINQFGSGLLFVIL